MLPWLFTPGILSSLSPQFCFTADSCTGTSEHLQHTVILWLSHETGCSVALGLCLVSSVTQCPTWSWERGTKSVLFIDLFSIYSHLLLLMISFEIYVLQKVHIPICGGKVIGETQLRRVFLLKGKRELIKET